MKMSINKYFSETEHLDQWEMMCVRSYQMSLFFPLLISHYELNHWPTNPTTISLDFAKRIKWVNILLSTYSGPSNV